MYHLINLLVNKLNYHIINLLVNKLNVSYN